MATAKCAYASHPGNIFLVQGPVGHRAKYNLSLNETSSVTDRVFDDLRKKQHLTQNEFAKLKSPESMIEDSEEMIQDHIDKRIALFFQQLIVTYQVPFHFEMGDTQHQAPSAPTLTKKKGGETVKVPFNSAHSATIPCLYAYHKEDWDKWVADPQTHQKPTPFVYLKGSDTYNQHNSTLGLIKLVNSADISLDGTSQSTDQLRVKSIDIIQRAARGVISPRKGLKEFLQEAERVLNDRIDSPGVKEEIKQILRLYLERVENALVECEDNAFFDELINLKIDNEPDEAAKLRKLIYRKRFKIIRESQEVQSVIARKIHEVAVSIIGIDRKPANFDIVMKKKILSMCTNQQKKQLSRFFGVSLEQITHDLQGKRYRAAERKIDQAQHRQKFITLMRDIRVQCRSLVQLEQKYRAEVSCDLRNYKGWRQKDLVTEYRTVHHDGPMSQSTVSRLENTIKPIEKELAHRLAGIFGVDPGFFFPAIFTSVE